LRSLNFEQRARFVEHSDPLLLLGLIKEEGIWVIAVLRGVSARYGLGERIRAAKGVDVQGELGLYKVYPVV